MLPRKKKECGIKDSMSDERHAPKPRVVDARDHDLTRREFEEFTPRALAMGRNEAFGYEDNFRPCAVRCVRDGVVIADGTSPGMENVQTFEGFAIQRRRAA